MKMFEIFYSILKFGSIEVFKTLTNKEKILSLLKEIPRGTFNYKKFRKEFRGKTISSLDIPFEFAWQLPFLKVVTYPVGSALYMFIAFCFMLYVYTTDIVTSKYQQMKSKKEA